MAIGAVQPLQLHGAAAFGLYAAGVLALGSLLHYAVERPFLCWRERMDAGRAHGSLTVPAVAPPSGHADAYTGRSRIQAFPVFTGITRDGTRAAA